MSDTGKLLAAPRAIICYAVDGVAAMGVVGSLFNALPPIAAILAIIWYCIQIWESKTGQRWARRFGFVRRRSQR